MARPPGFDLPFVTQHIVQRGNNRQACFANEDGYANHLRELREAATKHMAYRALVDQHLDEEALRDIRAHTQQQRVLGNDRSGSSKFGLGARRVDQSFGRKNEPAPFTESTPPD